jgi:hypothetical protein
MRLHGASQFRVRVEGYVIYDYEIETSTLFAEPPDTLGQCFLT